MLLKKLFLLTMAVCALAACDKEEDEIRYASQNDYIENGQLIGINLHFYGTTTVVDAQGTTYTGNNVWFEFAGGTKDFALYLHNIRFEAAQPTVSLRLFTVLYTPTGDKTLTFSDAETTPGILKVNQVGGGMSYQSAPDYLFTDFNGTIDGVTCSLKFTCAGNYHVTYSGRLIIN